MLRACVLSVVLALAGCMTEPVASDRVQSSPALSAAAATAEVQARQNRFASYPQPDMTYLSFSHAHGYQVNYLGADGRAWLWYPGNRRGVAEDFQLSYAWGEKVICWRHPSNSYNPVTKKKGGDYACESLNLAQRATVAALKGDVFELKSGAVPYRLDRCLAPEAFDFDRSKFGC